MLRLTLLVALVSVSPAAGAQEVTAKRAFAAITVSDLSASVRWYADNLGMREVSRSKGRGGTVENVGMMNDVILVELIHFADRAQRDTSVRDPRNLGLQKVGVWLDSASYRRTFDRLRESGARFVGREFTDRAIGARMFIVMDNSGTYLQFFTTQ